MIQDHTNDPRPQYYNFAHLVLPEVFTRDVAKFMATMSKNGAEFLRYLWKQVGVYEKISQPMEAMEQIAVENHTLETAYVAIITLPLPQKPTEAYFCAAVHNPITGQNRYFTLEYGQNSAGSPRTVFGEWQDNRHLNYGDGPAVDTQAFLSSIVEKLEAVD